MVRTVWGDDSAETRGRDSEAFAFYEADFDPASARFRLEKQWGDPKSRSTQAVRALAKLDAARALEWAAQLPEQEEYEPAQFRARQAIARWLYADAEAREKLGFYADKN